MQAISFTIRNNAQIYLSSANREKITAVACVTLLPILYLVGKALMVVLP